MHTPVTPVRFEEGSKLHGPARTLDDNHRKLTHSDSRLMFGYNILDIGNFLFSPFASCILALYTTAAVDF